MQLQPGTYRLVRDVENPCIDRRTRHDWRESTAVIKAGTTFRVEADREHNKLLGIYLVGHRYTHQHLYTRSDGTMRADAKYAELTNALVAAFEPIKQTHESWLDENGISDRFARWLVTSEHMTRDELKRLYDKWNEE